MLAVIYASRTRDDGNHGRRNQLLVVSASDLNLPDRLFDRKTMAYDPGLIEPKWIEARIHQVA